MATVVCCAVVGQQNNPLYIQTLQEDSGVAPRAAQQQQLGDGHGGQDAELAFHYIIHCALDAVEEKVNAVRRVPGEAHDPYLGVIYPTQDHKVYGYVSNTRARFFLVVGDGAVRDDEMRALFKRFHTAYVDAVSNPFYTANTEITSTRFDASVRTIVSSLGAAA